MGGFLLIRNGTDAEPALLRERYARAFEVFEKRNQSLAKEVTLGAHTLYVYHKIRPQDLCFYEVGNGDFIVATGTLLYRESTGVAAVRRLYDDMKAGVEYERDLYGNFAVIVSIDHALRVFTDYGGIYRVYQTADGDVLTSSFLAACRSCTSVSLAKQEFYEYLYNGATYGGKTYIEEVSLLDSERHLWLEPERRVEERSVEYPQLQSKGFSDAVQEVASTLGSYFDTLYALYGDSVTAALSGGYDSRLMLALSRRAGINPALYVYGSAQSSDVRTARRIAEGERIPLDHIDKNAYPEIALKNFREVVMQNYFHFDGFNVVGVFDNGADLDTRLKRTSTAVLQLNGGGGEIYRNFWELPDRSFSAEEFVLSRFTAIDDPVFQQSYGDEAYKAAMAEKIRTVLHVPSGKLTRRDVERLYPLWRLRYWMGVNNQVNNMFASTLTPYAEPAFAEQSYDLPIRYKNNGVFQAAIITAVDPRLASYTSSYGYNFTEPLPAKQRAAGFAKRNVPVWLRPQLRKRYRQFASSKPYWLSDEYVGTILDLKQMTVAGHISIDGIRNMDMLSRVYSVELLLHDCAKNGI